MEDIKAKKKTQFINYLTILNHQNRLLNIGPICPKGFEDVQSIKFGNPFITKVVNSKRPNPIIRKWGI